jgi:hypothetical protein
VDRRPDCQQEYGGCPMSTTSTCEKELLEQLEGVRKAGRGWIAKCPAHPDRTPSLSVTVGSDGRLLIHCFAGCAVLDVLGALNLTIADLFPIRDLADMTPAKRHDLRQARRTTGWSAALRVIYEEVVIVEIAAAQLLSGEVLNESDWCRLLVASERLSDAKAVFHDR